MEFDEYIKATDELITNKQLNKKLGCAGNSSKVKVIKYWNIDGISDFYGELITKKPKMDIPLIDVIKNFNLLKKDEKGFFIYKGDYPSYDIKKIIEWCALNDGLINFIYGKGGSIKSLNNINKNAPATEKLNSWLRIDFSNIKKEE